jgi:hypothetical protein
MSTITIPNLPAAGALTGTEVLPIVQSNITSKTTVQAIADLAGGLPYKSYTARISQSGTNNPTVDILFYNNTGLTFSWVRLTNGIYYAQPVGIDYSKVAIFITNGTDGTAPYATVLANSGGGPTGFAIWLYTYNSTDSSATDGELKNTSIEIRVYN